MRVRDQHGIDRTRATRTPRQQRIEDHARPPSSATAVAWPSHVTAGPALAPKPVEAPSLPVAAAVTLLYSTGAHRADVPRDRRPRRCAHRRADRTGQRRGDPCRLSAHACAARSRSASAVRSVTACTRRSACSVCKRSSRSIRSSSRRCSAISGAVLLVYGILTARSHPPAVEATGDDGDVDELDASDSMVARARDVRRLQGRARADRAQPGGDRDVGRDHGLDDSEAHAGSKVSRARSAC